MLSPRLPWLLACAAMGLRLLSLPLYPLTDTTEARYALIARTMAQTGDWITPWFAPGVPFWGKPPLAFWATAGLFRLGGFSEFAARMGTFLPMAGVLLMVGLWARRERGAATAALAVLLLATNALFFLCAGSVLTDAWLSLATTLAFLGFWRALNGHRRGLYLAAAAIGVGLLAKGPLTLVLVLPPAAAVLALDPDRRRVLHWPWLRALGLALLIALPWYVLAERKTPGFLEYFIVGEHWLRYVQPGWAGDRYGSAHLQPPGTMVLYALVAFLPWTLWLPLRARALYDGARSDPAQRRWLIFLLAWGLWPILFFSAARNVLPTYLLPAVPAWALLLAEALRDTRWRRSLLVGAALVPALLLAALAAYSGGALPLRSEKALVAAAGGAPIRFVGRAPFSARLYGGTSVSEGSADEATRHGGYVAVPRKAAGEVPPHWQRVAEDSRYVLFRTAASAPSAQRSPLVQDGTWN